MNAAGIIVEYNPLHNGHLYHIKKTREITGCDTLIAVMSGSFVQRGEPAL
jgi:predicted nucleotidyltransferase